MDSFPQNTALLIIDVQEGFNDPVWGERNNPQMETHVASLLWSWRVSHRPIFHIRHASAHHDSPLHPSKTGFAFQFVAHPRYDETIITKSVNSALIDTELLELLREKEVEHLVIIGLTTNHCVSSTARMASNLGFNTYIIKDATAAFAKEWDGQLFSAELIHNVSLANLSDEFATILDTETAFLWSRPHPERQRASLSIIRGDEILLLYRFNRGVEYYELPGGGVEPGESLAEGAIREAKEETGLDIVVGPQLWTYANHDHCFLITQFEGELEVGGPEAAATREDNRYLLEWHPIASLAKLPVVPAPLGWLIYEKLGTLQ